MSELQMFESPEFGKIRTAIVDGKLLFCAKDVAVALGYSRPASAVAAHCKGVCVLPTPTNGGVQKIKYITEGDLYRLIINSKLPAAEKFEKWVMEEILPSIRRQGAYWTEERVQAMRYTPGTVTLLSRELEAERSARVILAKANHAMKPKADYYDALVDKTLLTGVRETAIELGVPERRFIRFLLECGFAYRSPGGNLMPYAAYIEKDWFVLKEFCRGGYVGTQMFFTPKGRNALRLLKNDRGGFMS